VLPGKKYTPEDTLRIAWRHKWAILLPFLVISAGAIVGAQFLPDKYRSETLILVVPQRVPESYVRSTVTTRIEDRLQSIGQEILSRTRLERIIDDFNLYERERRNGIMQDIVEKMRSDISVEIVKGDAFLIAYVGEEPKTVMQVTDRLASLFIEENLKDRELLAEGTNEFLEAQLEESRRRLIEQEKKLEAYRKKYSGELPSQADANLQVIQNTQMQIQAVLESINRDRDRKLVVERMLSDLTVPETEQDDKPKERDKEKDAADPLADGTAPATAADQLAVAQRSLKALELRLTPEHPDVVRMRRVVAELQQRADAESLDAPLSRNPAAKPKTPAEIAKQNRVKELQGEIANLDRQIASKLDQEHKLRQITAQYQSRIEVVPTRETELAELTRDYATQQSMYSTLLAKKEESKIAANLERRQIGEQFKLLDRARLPEKPSSPNRLFIALVGALSGLGCGIGLAALLAYRDTSFRTDEDVMTVLKLPVLARVPVMLTPAEARRIRRTKIALSFAAAALCVIGGASAFAWKLGILRDLIR
jgi:polysaccharide chain length determinant protein (PEP-CTERM system associated)